MLTEREAEAGRIRLLKRSLEVLALLSAIDDDDDDDAIFSYFFELHKGLLFSIIRRGLRVSRCVCVCTCM